MIQDQKIAERGQKGTQRAAHIHQDLKSSDIAETWVDEYGIDGRVEVRFVERTDAVQRRRSKEGLVSYFIEPYTSQQISGPWAIKSETGGQTIEVAAGLAELSGSKLKSRSWRGEVITLLGNIDCYHPVERKHKTTRRLLEIFLKYKHPVRIVTSSTLILRDMDLLTQLAKHDLVEVCVTVATLHRELDGALMPDAAALQRRMQMVKMLSDRAIAVSVLVSPIIPGLNDEGIFTLVKVAAAHGAVSVVPTIHHVSGEEAKQFKLWARSYFPYRWRRIVRSVEEKHRAMLLLSDTNERKHKIAAKVSSLFKQFQMAANAYDLSLHPAELNKKLYNGTAAPQMSFF